MLTLFALTALMLPAKSLAAGGIFASGGKTVTVGETFTVTVAASGANFNAAQGKISVSGPVSVVSFSAGSANSWTWTSTPTNGGTFVGVLLAAGQRISSLTIATIKLKGTGVGSGSVSVSGVALEPSAGNGAGGTNFTIQKAPDLPGKVTVSSSSHPDPAAAYEATTIVLSWNKDAGVDGFSYILDQAEGTTPGTKADSAETTISYADKAIGTYYFHIRAHKTDGWGGSTHFKINIKEPDAKIDATLFAPHDVQITKDSTFENNIADGTVSGITISGATEPGFTANLTLLPAPTIPAGKVMTAVADTEGKFSLLIDFPIASGFHKLTIQGQKDKVLTPVSDELRFEIVQAKGGTINMITDEDKLEPVPVKAEETNTSSMINKTTAFYVILGLFVLIILVLIFFFAHKNKKNKNILREIAKR